MTTAAIYFAEAFVYSKIRADDGDFSDAEMLILLDGALNRLSTHKDWPWLYKSATVDTVKDTRTVTLDPTVTKASWFAIDDLEIVVAQRRSLIRYNHADVFGKPFLYKIVNGTMSLYPLPDDVYTIDYTFWASPTAVNDLAVNIDWPDEYSDVLLWELIHRMGLRKGDYILADVAEAKVARGLVEIYDNIRMTSQMPVVYVRNDW